MDFDPGSNFGSEKPTDTTEEATKRDAVIFFSGVPGALSRFGTACAFDVFSSRNTTFLLYMGEKTTQSRF